MGAAFPPHYYDQERLLNGLWPDRDGVVHSGVSWLPLCRDMGLSGCILPALERPAMLVTTLTACIGSLSLRRSAFVPIGAFGVLASAAMVVALLGDLVLLPATTAIGSRR